MNFVLAAALTFTWDYSGPGSVALYGTLDGVSTHLASVPVPANTVQIPPDALLGPGLIEYRARAEFEGDVSSWSNVLYECAGRSATCTPPSEQPGAWVVSAGCHAFGSSDSWIAPPLLCSFDGIDPASVRYEIYIEGHGGVLLVTPATLPSQLVTLPPGPPDSVVTVTWDLIDTTAPVTAQFTTSSGSPQIDFIQAHGILPLPSVCDGEQDRFRSCCQAIGGC